MRKITFTATVTDAVETVIVESLAMLVYNINLCHNGADYRILENEIAVEDVIEDPF